MASSLITGDFISQFHSIPGTSIGVKRKNFFHLLCQASETKLFIDFEKIQPRTRLEENFKIDALIFFNKTELLLSEFTTENPVLIQRIIKRATPTLIQFLCNVTDEQLLNFLGKISLNAKLKILNKCGKNLNNSNKAESFFNSIKDKYGVYLATKLLSACSPGFIIAFLETTRFKFPSSQFLVFAKKHPDFVCRLLEILHKHIDVTQYYSKVFRYLAQNNVPLFITIRKIHNLQNLQIGRRSTNTFIKHNKFTILSNAKVYFGTLQTKHIRKSLSSEDYNTFYYGLFPTLVTQFEGVYEEMITQAPNLDVLLKGFRNVYGTELCDNPSLITPKLLAMLPNDERLKILKPEYKPSEFTDDDWVCYLSTSQAIPLLKKRVFLTSDIKSRTKLVSLFVETCRINKDKPSLLEMCNYMIKQHRNDHISVRLGFLKAIKRDFKLENLDMTHWVPINELIHIFELNGEEFYYLDDFIISYIECCIKNNQPIKDVLATYIKRRTYWTTWNLLKNKPAYEKVCLQTIPTLLEGLGSELLNNTLAYIGSILDWNKRHPRDEFPVFENTVILERFKESLIKKTPQRHYDLIIWYIITSKTLSDRGMMLESWLPEMDLNKFTWLFHNDIDFLLHNFDRCVNVLLKSSFCTDSLWLYCKLYTHLDIPQKIINICLHTLAQEQPDTKLVKKNALTALSFLMPVSDLLGLKYSIGPYMKNINPNEFLLDVIIKFCNVNRLPSVKRAIFSLSNNLNEAHLLNFIQQLTQIQNEHVRKVILQIVFRTMEKHTIMNILKEFLSDPSNAALNKFILSSVFKYFIKSPNEFAWETIQLSVATLDVDDQEAYSLIFQPDKVPEEYLVHYVLFMWGTVEKLPDFYKNYGAKLLQICEVNSLPNEFCEALIEKYFFSNIKNYPGFYIELDAFVCKFLCKNPTKLPEYLVRKILPLHNTSDLKVRGYLNHFVRQMCYECIKQNKRDVLNKFAELWSNATQPYEMYVEYLQIQLALLKVDNLPANEIAARLAFLCNDLTGKYGSEFLVILAQEVRLFLDAYFLKDLEIEQAEINRFTIIKNIIKINDVILVLFGMLLLENHVPSLIETKKTYDEMIEIFRKRPELEVSLYLSDVLKV